MKGLKPKHTHSSNPRGEVPYTQNGVYHKGQRVLHPMFGWATVVKVRWGKVVLLVDADVHPDDDAEQLHRKERRFVAAKLDLDARNRANGRKKDEFPDEDEPQGEVEVVDEPLFDVPSFGNDQPDDGIDE